MNDCKELIAKLRFYANTADNPIYGICINSPKVMLQAADAIEQLVKERDAAINERKVFSCKFCNENNCGCKHCSNSDWCGKKEDNDG